MNTTPVTSANLVSPVGRYEPREQDQSLGHSEELGDISARLKEALEGLNAWIQIFALMPSPLPDNLTVAANELARLNDIFQNAYGELLSYSRQIPETTDAPFAYEMLKILETCFLEEIGKETPCEFPGVGFTSWGDLILSIKEVKWTPPLLQSLLDQISAANWKTARLILSQTQTKLP